MKKLKGKYIGFFKIKKATIHDSKTYFGKERVLIEYEDIPKELQEKLGKKKSDDVFPKKTLVHIVTDKMSDFTEVQIARVTPTVAEILAILVESELTMEDAKYAINTKLIMSMDDTMDRAATKLWGKPYSKLTLLDVERVLENEKKT